MFGDRSLRANGLQDYVPPFSLRRAQLIKGNNASEAEVKPSPVTKWTNQMPPNPHVHQQQSYNYDKKLYTTGDPIQHNRGGKSLCTKESVDNGIGDVEAMRRKEIPKTFDAHASLAANWPFDKAGIYRDPSAYCGGNNLNVIQPHESNYNNLHQAGNPNHQIHCPNQYQAGHQQYPSSYPKNVVPANPQQTAVVNHAEMINQANRHHGAMNQQYYHQNQANPGVTNQYHPVGLQNQQQNENHHIQNHNHFQQPGMTTNQYLPSIVSQNTADESNPHLQQLSNSYNQVASNIPVSPQHSVPQEHQNMSTLNGSATNSPNTQHNYHPMHYVHFHPDAQYMKGHVNYQQMPQVSQHTPLPEASNINNLAPQGDVIPSNVSENEDNHN